MSLDPYKVLGIEKKADEAAIKSAYRQLARKYHPDLNPNDKAAEDKFKEISEAYDILSDPAKRSEYDQLGREAFYERGFGGAGYQRPDFNQGGFSFEDIFGELFGGRSGRNGRSAGFNFEGSFGGAPSRKGADGNFKMTISLKEAAFGTEAQLEVNLPQRCPKCQGQGVVAAGGGIQTCPTCGGRGQASHVESLKVKIPAGIEDGQKVRLRGKGSPGENGGPAGDLLVEIAIKSDSVFTRVKRDLQIELPLSLYDALLGATVEVPTLSGRASLKIPQGTANGTKMRLKGQGLPATAKKEAGDLYVTLKVILPQNLSPEAQELVQKLAELAPLVAK